MSPRVVWSAAVAILCAGACSTTAPTATSSPTPAPASASAPVAPLRSPEPSVDPNSLPPTTTTGWWGDPDGSDCRTVGHYRVGYAVAQLGDCLGNAVGVPREVTLDVGQDMDLHMTIPKDGEPPIYPLPEPDDPLVVKGWLMFDAATLTYKGLSPGTARLMSAASPILVVHVRNIDTSCVELAEDVCRAVAATAVFGAFTDPGQKIVGWVAKPSTSSMEWPGCGHVFATVTFSLIDPDVRLDVSVGRFEPPTSGPQRYGICTY